MIGWYIRSLNNCDELERAIEVSLQYEEQGADDARWHYRLGYSYFYLGRDEDAEKALLRGKELAGSNEELTEWIDELLGFLHPQQNLEVYTE